jgi:predicted O-methyltransferase YrrM
MSNNTVNMTPALQQYMLQFSLREHPILKALRDKTATMVNANMQIAPEQGQFMQMLIRLINAKKTLEVGTFTGYSTLSVALALPEDGKITACDISDEWTKIAMDYWQQAGVEHKISLHIAPASQTLEKLIQSGEAGSYDFAFIDADKPGYASYYEYCLTLVRQGGLIAVDNVLWGGDVANANINDPDTQAIRALNEGLLNDTRVDISLLPIADGLTLIRKR